MSTTSRKSIHDCWEQHNGQRKTDANLVLFFPCAMAVVPGRIVARTVFPRHSSFLPHKCMAQSLFKPVGRQIEIEILKQIFLRWRLKCVVESEPISTISSLRHTRHWGPVERDFSLLFSRPNSQQQVGIHTRNIKWIQLTAIRLPAAFKSRRQRKTRGARGTYSPWRSTFCNTLMILEESTRYLYYCSTWRRLHFFLSPPNPRVMPLLDV